MTLFFSVYHTVFIDRYLGYIWTDLIEKKDPIVIMGHLGVPTKKMVKGNECFIFYCAVCVAPNMLIILFTSPAGLLGCYMLSDNSFSCFRRKAF